MGKNLSLDDEQDELLTLSDVAAKLDISPQSVELYIKQGKLPVERPDGKQRFARMSVCERIKELREEHGRAWFKHADWNEESEVSEVAGGEGQEEDTSSEELDLIDGDESDEEEESEQQSSTLAEKIVERAQGLMEEGKHEIAAELYSVLADHCDWSQVQ